MVIRNEIFQEIRTNVPLRKTIAAYLGITDASVYNSAVRKAPRFSHYHVIKIIMEHTGKNEEQIFVSETNE